MTVYCPTVGPLAISTDWAPWAWSCASLCFFWWSATRHFLKYVTYSSGHESVSPKETTTTTTTTIAVTTTTHPLLGTVPLEDDRLALARARGELLVLEGVEDVVPVQAGEVAVARLPAPLALGAVRGAGAGADLFGALLLGVGGGGEGVGEEAHFSRRVGDWEGC